MKMYRHSGYSRSVLFTSYNALFVLVSILFMTEAKGPLCLKCDRVRQPYDCTNVIRCGEHELCSVRKYITADGHILFDVDCSDSQKCHVPPVIFGRREITEKKPGSNKRTNSGEITRCRHCCEGDICNSGTICGANKFEHNNNLICFKCQLELGPDTCNTVTKCGQDQVCYLESGRSGLSNEIIWTSGCKSNSECAHETAIQAGLCSECCNSDICNLKCSVRNQGVPQIDTAIHCADKDPSTCDRYGKAVCTQFVEFAKINCASLCNMCGSVITTKAPTKQTPIPKTGCLYKGRVYRQHESWKDGCKHKCRCENGRTGRYHCTPLCVVWNLAPVCRILPPRPGKCCSIPSCPMYLPIRYPPGYKEE